MSEEKKAMIKSVKRMRAMLDAGRKLKVGVYRKGAPKRKSGKG